MQDAISPANSEARPASAEFDEIPNLVVDEVEPISDEERNLICETVSMSHRGKPRGRGLARGSRGKRTTTSDRAIVMDISEMSNSNSRPTQSRKQKASRNTDNTIEKQVRIREELRSEAYPCILF